MTSPLQSINAYGRAFLIDYISRHKHPLNAVLHLFGVPMVFIGIYELCLGHPALGIAWFVLGYLFQYLGHKAQGNEVGEVILIKAIWKELRSTKRQ